MTLRTALANGSVPDALVAPMREWEAQIIADLGGDVTSLQKTIIELAVRERALLNHLDAYIFKEQAIVDKRRRAAMPIVRDRMKVSDALARHLLMLGSPELARRPQKVQTLEAYVSTRYGNGDHDGDESENANSDHDDETETTTDADVASPPETDVDAAASTEQHEEEDAQHVATVPDRPRVRREPVPFVVVDERDEPPSDAEIRAARERDNDDEEPSRRAMKWSDLPRSAQRNFANVKGVVPPDVIQEFLDRLERDAQSYVRDAVAAFREADAARARRSRTPSSVRPKTTPSRTRKEPSR